MRVMRGGGRLLVLAAMAAALGAAEARAAIPPERLDALDAYLPTVPKELGVPGVALVVVDDGEVVRQTALGVADGTGRPVTPQTPFMLASTSKAFTALAVMQLVEAGKVDLDAPVRTYVPWFAVADAEASAAITPRQLLTHTSGLSTAAGRWLLGSDDQDEGALDRGVRQLASAELVGAPGERYEYSNANYNVLGMIVEAVAGTPFSEYLEANVFAPLGMTHSHATVEAARADGLSEGFYPWWGGDWRPNRVQLPRGSGPSATTFVSVEDLGHAIQAHLNGGERDGTRVLSPEGIAAMQAPGVSIDDFHAYGMGWVIRPYWELLDAADPQSAAYRVPALIEHDGDWANAKSYVGLVPSEGWGFGVLLNGNDETSPDRLPSVFNSLLNILAGREAVGPPASGDLLASNARQIAALLLILELLSLAWSIWWLARRAWGRVGTGRRLFALGAPLVLDLLVLWLALVYIPAAYDTTLSQLLKAVPDIALLATAAVAVAAVWGTIRTGLMLAAWWRAHRSRFGDGPAMASAPA